MEFIPLWYNIWILAQVLQSTTTNVISFVNGPQRILLISPMGVSIEETNKKKSVVVDGNTYVNIQIQFALQRQCEQNVPNFVRIRQPQLNNFSIGKGKVRDGQGMWRVWGRIEVCTGCWWGSLWEGGHWGDQDVDGRIILRWIFRKLEGVVGTGWSWLRIGTGGGHLWVRCGTFGFHKCGEFHD